MEEVGVFDVIRERYTVGSALTFKGKLTADCGVLTKALHGYRCTDNECDCHTHNSGCVNAWDEECAQPVVADFFEWAVSTFGKKKVEEVHVAADVDESGVLSVTMDSPTKRQKKESNI